MLRKHLRERGDIMLDIKLNFFLLELNKVILKWRMFLEFVNGKVLMTLKS